MTERLAECIKDLINGRVRPSSNNDVNRYSMSGRHGIPFEIAFNCDKVLWVALSAAHSRKICSKSISFVHCFLGLSLLSKIPQLIQ